MKLIYIASLFVFTSINIASACVLSMGYRSNERLPLIKAEPDNSGLYQELYAMAAEKIGCSLTIERGPKKRILKMLKLGKIDFYPGFNFTSQRAKNFYYIENGLPGGDIGISLTSLPTITDLSQLKGYTLLTALGSADFSKKMDGINLHKVRELTIPQAVALLQKKRGDFYIYNKETLQYYLKVNKVKNIKTHPDCCGGIKPLYLGFSKSSPHYQQQNNPIYDKNKNSSIENYPVTLKESSIAYQFQQALQQLKESGKTDELYSKYYH